MDARHVWPAGLIRSFLFSIHPPWHQSLQLREGQKLWQIFHCKHNCGHFDIFKSSIHNRVSFLRSDASNRPNPCPLILQPRLYKGYKQSGEQFGHWKKSWSNYCNWMCCLIIGWEMETNWVFKACCKCIWPVQIFINEVQSTDGDTLHNVHIKGAVSEITASLAPRLQTPTLQRDNN